MNTVFQHTHLSKYVFNYLTIYDLVNFEKSHKKGKEALRYLQIWNQVAIDHFSYQFPQEINLKGKDFLSLCQNRDLNIRNGNFIPHELPMKEKVWRYATSESNFCYLTGKLRELSKDLYVLNFRSGQTRKLEGKFSLDGHFINDGTKLAINVRWLVITQQSPRFEGNVTVYDLSNDEPRLIKFKERVHAVALNGNILLTGHENGDVYSTDLLPQEKDLLSRKEKHLSCSEKIRSITVFDNRIYISYGSDNIAVVKKEGSSTYPKEKSSLYVEIPYSEEQRLFFNENNPDCPIVAQQKGVSDITDYPESAIYVSNAEATFVKSNRCFIPDSVKVFEIDDPLPPQSIAERLLLDDPQYKFNIGRIAIQKLKNSSMEFILHSDGLRFVGLRASGLRDSTLVVYDYSCSPDQILEFLANSLETTDPKNYPTPEAFQARIAELTLCFNNLADRLKKRISKEIFQLIKELQALPICKDENSLNFSNIFYNKENVKKMIADALKLIAKK